MLKKNCVVACLPIVACSYLRSHLDGTHTLTGQQLTGNVSSLVETDKFLNPGGEKLNTGGFQAWLGERID